MAMHHRGREPPGSGPGGGGTNPFTGRGLPSVRSPYRPNNIHGGSNGGGYGASPNVTNMIKKAILILLSFIIFFFFIGSGVDEEYVPKQQQTNEYTIDSIATTMKNNNSSDKNRGLGSSGSRFDKRKKKNNDSGLQKEPTKLILPPPSNNNSNEISESNSRSTRHTQEIGFGNNSFEERDDGGESRSKGPGNSLPEYLNLHTDGGGINDMNLHVEREDNTNNNLGFESEPSRKFDNHGGFDNNNNIHMMRGDNDDEDNNNSYKDSEEEKKNSSDAYLGFGDEGSQKSKNYLDNNADWSSGENEAPPSRDGFTPRSNDDNNNHDGGKYLRGDNNDNSEDGIRRVSGGGLRGGMKDDIHSRSSKHHGQFGRGSNDSDEQQDDRYGGSRQRHQYRGDADVFVVVSEDEKSIDKNSFDRYASDRHARLNGGGDENVGIEDSYYRKKKNGGLSMEKAIHYGMDDNNSRDDHGANRGMNNDSHDDVARHNAFYKHQDQMAIPRAIADDNPSSPDSKESFYKQVGRPFETNVSSDVKKYLASMNKDSVSPLLDNESSGDKTNLSADLDTYKKKRLHSRKVDKSGDLNGEVEDRYSRAKKSSNTYDKYNEDGYKKRGSGERDEEEDRYSRTKKVSNTNDKHGYGKRESGDFNNEVENRYSREKNHSVYNKDTYDEHGYKNRHKMDEHESAKEEEFRYSHAKNEQKEDEGYAGTKRQAHSYKDKFDEQVQSSANRMEYEIDSRHKASREHSTYRHADGGNSGDVERYGDPHKPHHMHDFSKDEKSPILDSDNLVAKEEHYSEKKHPIVPDYPGSPNDVKHYAKFDQDNLLNEWKDLGAPGGEDSKSEDLSKDVKRYVDSYEENKYQDKKRKHSTYKNSDDFGASNQSKRVVDRDEEYDTASAKERFFDEAKSPVKHNSDKAEQSKKYGDEYNVSSEAEMRDISDDGGMKSRRVKKMMYNANGMDQSGSDDAANTRYHETDGEGLVSNFALKVRPGESALSKEYSENRRSKMKDRYAIEDSKPTEESRDLPDENEYTKKYQKRGSNSRASGEEAFFDKSRMQIDPIDSGRNSPHSGDILRSKHKTGEVRNAYDEAEFSSHEKKTINESGSKDQAEYMKRPTIDSDKTPRLEHGDISIAANRLDDIDTRIKASRKHSTYKQDGDSTLSDDVKRYRDSHQANVVESSKDGLAKEEEQHSESRNHSIMGNPGRISLLDNSKKSDERFSDSGDTKSYLKSNNNTEDNERANEIGSDASEEQKVASDSQDTDTKVNDKSYLAAERKMAGSGDREELDMEEVVRADESGDKEEKSKSIDGNVQDKEVSREELEPENEDEGKVKEEPLTSSELVVSKSRSSDQEGENSYDLVIEGVVDANSHSGDEEATMENDDEETKTELLSSYHIKSKLEKNISEKDDGAAEAKLELQSDDGQEKIS